MIAGSLALVDWNGIRGLLFDKDGTLIDFFETWMPAYCEAADRIAADAGVPEAADRMLEATGFDRPRGVLVADSALAGGTNQEIIDVWCGELGEAAPADMDETLLKIFAGHATGEVAPTVDLPVLCSVLTQRGYMLGIATNDDAESAAWTAEHLGITGMMTFVTGADAGHGGKPGPGMGLAFCEAAGIAPHQAAMVGDSAADALMAQAAGFGASIGVCTGAASAAELEPYFDVVLPDIGGLPKLLWGKN
ncbi:MAG: hypothetical protein CMM46_08100 [Rhodospirillaceae bacterium]|nr:hypothetical protein [Rhodospirillaceae bacterium]